MSLPIILHDKPGAAPNPTKVVLLLEELRLPYEKQMIKDADLHTPSYETINPNGRVPSIHDPNTDVVMFESGAIIEYLIDTYDNYHKLSYPHKSKQDYLTKQWLFFQASGQGPYYGQGMHFIHIHPAKVQSAIDRYTKEVKRVIMVLNAHLEKEATGWLVGGKCTYADLSFLPWNYLAIIDLLSKDESLADAPHFKKWHEAMMIRPSTKVAFKKMIEAAESYGLDTSRGVVRGP
ncbi:MAG: glutathione S- transferase, nitrogen catabolite repression regulator [Chrysothrix sp. TS-e1954]|nr:MAG: glutathione S- transferase, nitrogen catabolite repression regulator [Chrysothrix sp. TS-e1954]